MVLLKLVVTLLSGEQLLEVLRFLDEAVETAGQVNTLAPGNLHVLVLDERVAEVWRLIGDILYEVCRSVVGR